MSRLGTYLVRGSRFDTILGTSGKKKKSTMLGFFLFILNRQFFHLDAKIQIINTNNIITLLYYV